MDKIMNEREVAEYLLVKRPTVEKWRRTGRGPDFIKTGRIVRYRKSDVDRWLDENTVNR